MGAGLAFAERRETVSVSPSLGRPGYRGLPVASPKRAEQIERLWTFLTGIVTRTLRFSGASPTVGQLLAASDTDGNVAFSSTTPASRFSDTAQTASQTGTLVLSSAGDWLVQVYVECVTAGAAGTLAVTITYTDDVGSVTPTLIAAFALTATGRDTATRFIHSASGGIDYTITVTGPIGNPAYTIYIDAAKMR